MTDSKLKIVNPWYKEGLNFKCTECGKCCTGSPGYTWVSKEEIAAMAKYLDLSLEDFGKKYLRKVENKWALLEKPGNYDCIFLKDKKCEIYPVRPTQCRTFPWWLQNLTSLEAWINASFDCEGIGSEDELVPFEDIEEKLTEQINYEKNRI